MLLHLPIADAPGLTYPKENNRFGNCRESHGYISTEIPTQINYTYCTFRSNPGILFSGLLLSALKEDIRTMYSTLFINDYSHTRRRCKSLGARSWMGYLTFFIHFLTKICSLIFKRRSITHHLSEPIC